MFKWPAKAVWIAAPVLLLAAGAIIKLAFAITAFVPANQPIGYISQDEVSNFDLRSGNEVVFRTQYEREHWSGTIFYYPISASGEVGSSQWNGDEMDFQNFDTGRFMATMRDDGVAVPFRLAELSAAQQLTLNDSTGLVNFLRGDQSGAGTLYRDRQHVLGDVIHSRPLYVADADNPTLFVGANDGMLHAINATAGGGGVERWAYVPSMLLPKMKNLAAIPYVHDYYVDGQINVGKIEDDTIRMLVGGLGAGGKGLYALNITGSAGLAAISDAEVASKVMWEISPTKLSYANPATANAFINLGYTYGTITIAKMRVSGAVVDVVIVGNGYNDGVGSYANCSHASPSYVNCGGDYAAYLFVIDAKTGQLVKSMKAGGNGTAASPNGLSSAVAIDTDADGLADRVYAGDLDGTMWKFDFGTDLTSGPAVVGSASALLTTSPAQAITAQPGVAAHPEGGFMVAFGTGKALVDADLTDTSVHYAYGIWDGAPVLNSALLSQTLSERSYSVGGTTTRVRRVTSNQPVWASGAGNHKGWRVALTTDPAQTLGGERVLGEGSFIENGRFYFTGHDPNIATTITSTTTIVKGENWLMELDYLTGGSKNRPFLDLSADVQLDDNDRLRYIATDPEVVTTPSKLDTPILTTDGIPVGKFISIGNLSQPILVQLISLNDTLFNQNPDVAVPVVNLGQGVDGGHFDQDFYYGGNAAPKAIGTVRFTYAAANTTKNVTALTITANGETVFSCAALACFNNTSAYRPRQLDDFLHGKSSANYVISKDYGDTYTIKIEAKTAGAEFNGPVTVSITTDGTAPGFIKTDLAGGAAATVGDSCVANCVSQRHVHQYDDKFDVTGVNFLNPSDATQKLSLAIPSTSTQFKVLAQNQYLSPAVELHIGNPGYLFDVDAGYIRLKDYVTSATLDLATLPAYVLNPASAAYVGSLAINMPVDALTAKDWWGNGDVRAGLHPTVTGCVKRSLGANDGNMYQPVVPPVNGLDGPGVAGWDAATTPATATGVRHNGALVVQIIAVSTPNSAIEQSVPGRPEYGWRVKSAEYANYVLAEYTTFWHHPNGLCYTQAGWTKTPGPDTGSTTAAAKAAGSTDPKIGELGAGAGEIVSIVTTVTGNVTTTTITYANTQTATIVRTTNESDGTVTIVTTDTTGAETTQIVANTQGAIRSGGDERGLQARTGRISWRELVAP